MCDELWQRAHVRLEAFRTAYLRANDGKLWGRPGLGVESRYLLTGFAQCGACGGSLIVRCRDLKSHRRHGYLCANYHTRGRTVCERSDLIPMVDADHAVLATIERDMLRPEIVELALAKVAALLKPGSDDSAAQRDKASSELVALEAEITRLTAAIATGGELASLIVAINERRGGMRFALSSRLARPGSR